MSGTPTVGKRRQVASPYIGGSELRSWIPCVVILIGACIAVAQDSEPKPSGTLIDLLSAESAIAYRIGRDNSVYELKLISPAEFRASREYYSNRKANLAAYERLFDERRTIMMRQRGQEARGEEVDPADVMAIDKLTAELKKVSRPIGTYRVGEITRRGADYIGIRELNSNVERLIPISRILHVVPLPKKDGIE